MKGYFDFNATTPLSSAAAQAWSRASETHWHNPSSLYREAAVVSQLLDDMRCELADCVECDEPDRVLFNSGATEANNAVLAHIARSTTGRVAISAIEHPCVTDFARVNLGSRLIELPVDNNGVLSLDEFRNWLFDERDIALVSVMAANNECGTLQPWREVLALCRERGVRFHCDAAQWIGKLASSGLGDCDYLTGSAHKFGGPKGTGFLIVPENDDTFRSLIGGPQQQERRAGTENYPSVAGMMAAWRELEPGLETIANRTSRDRDWAEQSILTHIPNTQIVGSPADRLWNTILCILPDHDNRRWLTRLNRRGFCVSTGSACSSGKQNPSRVLQAMGYAPESMSRTLRISGGWQTDRADWEAIVEALCETHEELNRRL